MSEQWTVRKLIETADDMLCGKLDLIEGCRTIARPSHDFSDRPGVEEIFDYFAAVDSETDDLPVGAVRALWSEEGLRAKDQERDEYLERVREGLLDSCRRLRAALAPLVREDDGENG